MLSKIFTSSFSGVQSRKVVVEVSAAAGLPKFIVVGLPDKAVSEAKERILAAFGAMGFAIPAKRVVVNLAPADLAKEGSHFDLPIALGLLASLEVIPAEELLNFYAMGELSLDGSLKPVSSVMPAANAAEAEGMGIIVPRSQASEALWGGNKGVLAADNLKQLINHFTGRQILEVNDAPRAFEESYSVDMRDVKGQEMARRALEIAAVGGHHVLMQGPPGVGKSMLAQRLPTILPPMTPSEMLEVSMISSVAGIIGERGLSTTRPFRSPHHSASQAALTGGGMKAKPGEVSLAHNGVLFLDELPEFSPQALDSLRQPLESGQVTVARANEHITYPARFQFIAAMNPCKCGHFGNPAKACPQAPMCALKYQNRISGPMYDRIDLFVQVENVNPWELEKLDASESSDVIRARVVAAREFQRDRIARFFGEKTGKLNNVLSGDEIKNSGRFEKDAEELLIKSAQALGVSARGYFKAMRLARTIADMRMSEVVAREDIASAMMFAQRAVA